jgi:hypothetical protein
MAETVVTYTIRDSGSPGHPAFRYHVQVDNTPVATSVALSTQASRSSLDLSSQFNTSFERHRGGGISPEALVLGMLASELVALGEGWAWDKVTPLLRSGSQRFPVVASALPEVLNLPWELLRLDGAAVPRPGRQVRHPPSLPRVDRPLEAFDGKLSPAPCGYSSWPAPPRTSTPCMYEKEEETLLKAIGSTHSVAFDSGDLGSFEELPQRILRTPVVVGFAGGGLAFLPTSARTRAGTEADMCVPPWPAPSRDSSCGVLRRTRFRTAVAFGLC